MVFFVESELKISRPSSRSCPLLIFHFDLLELFVNSLPPLINLQYSSLQVIYSAWMGYGNYGCDVGGYRGGSDTKYATHFLRSAQLNAFLPLMENGGGGEHRPWMYEVNIAF